MGEPSNTSSNPTLPADDGEVDLVRTDVPATTIGQPLPTLDEQPHEKDYEEDSDFADSKSSTDLLKQFKKVKHEKVHNIDIEEIMMNEEVEQNEIEQNEEDNNHHNEVEEENNGDITKGTSKKRTRGQTSCKKIHARSIEEREEVILNDDGQPTGPREKISQLKDHLTQNPEQNHTEAFKEVFGKEKAGRVRCYGRNVTPTALKQKEKQNQIMDSMK
ncbi:Defective-in-cullin neddylation protein [Senna tora]|uniref:Defective-in-cullin neddylation protein n=1 Tax=Senna tora TaxID=362788 RepID=A0A835CHS9_9FABA|nr:Defective-in-cullin neddylation protein [Senna tora]